MWGFEGSSDFTGSLLESEDRDAGVSPEDTGAHGDTSSACGPTAAAPGTPQLPPVSAGLLGPHSPKL